MAETVKIDVHNFEDTYTKGLQRLKADAGISDSNRQLILKFNGACLSEGIGLPRRIKYLGTLSIIAKLFQKDFEQVTREDAERLVEHVRGGKLSEHTKHDYLVTLKKFYKWLNGGEECPQSVRWIKTGMGRMEKIKPAKLLTNEEIKKLIEGAPSIRDKALIAVLFESGFRVGELLCMQLEALDIRDGVIMAHAWGKTGSRDVPLVTSIPYVHAWLGIHPQKGNPKAPLWAMLTKKNGPKPVSYSRFRKVLRETARKMGISKPVNPHHFRHSIATARARAGTSEFQMDQWFGWVPGSKQPSTYVHLCAEDLVQTAQEQSGTKAPREQKKPFEARRCGRCDLINTFESKFCLRCGCPLDSQGITAVQKRERLLELLGKVDPAKLAELLRKAETE